MNSLISLFESLSPGIQSFLLIVIAISIVAIIVLLFLKLFRVAIVVFVLLLIVPPVFTVFFGDGREIVGNATKYFDEETGQQIVESYETFKEKDAELPGLNFDKIKEDWSSFKESIKSSESPEVTDDADDAEESAEPSAQP